MFDRPQWDLAIRPERLDLRDRGTGHSVQRKVRHSFVNEDTFVSNPELLEEEVRQCIALLTPARRPFLWKRLLFPYAGSLTYPTIFVRTPERSLSEHDIEMAKKAVLDAGASKVVFEDRP
jgi:hypothetical protein